MFKVRKDQELIHLRTCTTPVPGYKWESNKTTINVTNKSQDVSPFPSGDHITAMNKRESKTSENINNTNYQQKKYRLGTVSKIFY